MPKIFSARVLLTAISLCAAGCSVGLDYQTPETKAPATFGETHLGPTTRPMTTVDLAHWWKTFHDPMLDSLIDRAVKNNNTLLEAEANVRQARAQLGVDWGTEFPTLSANVAASRAQSSRTLTSGASGSTVSSPAYKRQTSLGQGYFDAGWEIDVFGGNRRGIEAGEDAVEASEDARRYAVVVLTAEVAQDYVALRGYQQELALTKSNAESEIATLKLTKSRFNAGLVSDLDVAQAEASVATTVAEEPTLQINIRQEIHAISILLGQEPMALSSELSPDKPIPPVPSEIPVGLPSELLRRRPDVRQAERQLAQSTANIGVQVANLFPKFSLTGTLGQESNRFGLIARDASSIWSIGPTVSWQILDYNQLQSQVRVANAQQQQALFAYRQTVLQSFGDVENALVAYAQDQVRTKALTEEVIANQRAVDLSNQRYQQGLGDFLDVLTAERNVFTAQSDLSVSQSSVATDLVNLFKSLGGGWDETDEENFHKFEDPKIPVAMK